MSFMVSAEDKRQWLGFSEDSYGEEMRTRHTLLYLCYSKIRVGLITLGIHRVCRRVAGRSS